jgi:hypothetical protein
MEHQPSNICKIPGCEQIIVGMSGYATLIADNLAEIRHIQGMCQQCRKREIGIMYAELSIDDRKTWGDNREMLVCHYYTKK